MVKLRMLYVGQVTVIYAIGSERPSSLPASDFARRPPNLTARIDMKLQKFCGCFASSNPQLVRTPTDSRIEATPAELQVIRDQLRPVEELLGKLFQPMVYDRTAKSMEIRAAAADVICEHFDGIIDEGAQMVGTILVWDPHPATDAHRIDALR